MFEILVHAHLYKHTVCITENENKPYLQNSVDPDLLADEASWTELMHTVWIYIVIKLHRWMTGNQKFIVSVS